MPKHESKYVDTLADDQCMIQHALVLRSLREPKGIYLQATTSWKWLMKTAFTFLITLLSVR